jgi:hypothetical protein
VRAEFDAMREMARLDRAGRIGEGVAQVEAARGRLGEATYELQTKILEAVVKFAPLLEGLVDSATAGVRGIDLVVATFNAVWSKVNDLPLLGGNPQDNQAAQDALKESIDAFRQALADVVSANGPANMGMDPFLASVLNMQLGPPNPPAPAAPGLNGGGLF